MTPKLADDGRRFKLKVNRASRRARILDPMMYGDIRARIRGVAPKGGPITQAKSSPAKKKKTTKKKTGTLVTATVKVKGYTVKPHTRKVKIRVGQGVR